MANTARAPSAKDFDRHNDRSAYQMSDITVSPLMSGCGRKSTRRNVIYLTSFMPRVMSALARLGQHGPLGESVDGSLRGLECGQAWGFGLKHYLGEISGMTWRPRRRYRRKSLSSVNTLEARRSSVMRTRHASARDIGTS